MVCMCVCDDVYMCMCDCVDIFVHVCLCRCVYAYLRRCVCVYMCACIGVYMHACLHRCIYACVFASVYICMCVWMFFLSVHLYIAYALLVSAPFYTFYIEEVSMCNPDYAMYMFGCHNCAITKSTYLSTF